MPALPPEGDTLCIDVTVWAHLTVTCVSLGLNLLPYSPTMIIYLSHQFSCNELVLQGVALFPVIHHHHC